jgi:peptidyl-prolyl cis-trans isomerase A (cyclophilin A)
MNKLVSVILFVALSIGTLQAQDELPAYPRILIETSAGNFTVELFSSRAPLSVRNFLDYVDSGFYSGTIFHRIVGGFVAQGGGYDESYKLKPTNAAVPNEAGNGLTNRRGYLAMARTAEPHSADSQFYVNLADNLSLDPRPTRWGYTVFGKVIEGMEVIDEIGYVATGPGPVEQLSKDVPKEPIIILKTTLLAEDSEQPDS